MHNAMKCSTQDLLHAFAGEEEEEEEEKQVYGI